MEKIKRAIEFYENLEKGALKNWTQKDIENHCRPFDKAIELEWNETKSFSVYRSKEYFYNLIFSYMYISKNHIESVLKWFAENDINISEKIAYDYYNGIGLTTIDLAKSFKKVIAFNDCKNQIDLCDKLFREYNLSYEKDIKKINKDCDVFFSLQEIEHYFNPIDRIKEILEEANNAEFLVLSHGFTNDRYCGHYTYYNVNNNLVHYTQVFGYIEQEILKRSYRLVFCNDRGKIRIYRKDAE